MSFARVALPVQMSTKMSPKMSSKETFLVPAGFCLYLLEQRLPAFSSRFGGERWLANLVPAKGVSFMIEALSPELRAARQDANRNHPIDVNSVYYFLKKIDLRDIIVLLP